MQDLGTLGGDNSGANFINDAGEIVGDALTADEQDRAFLWRHGMMTDLGTLGTDPGSVAHGINSQGQVVGNTYVLGTDLRGFLWEHGGPMVDLNTLIPSNPDLQLTRALYITDRGEIAAQGNFSTGVIHAFVLIPCDEKHPAVEGCDYSLVDTSAAPQSPVPRYVPNSTQRSPQSRWNHRYHIPGVQSGSR